jgi:hypothetical protein
MVDELIEMTLMVMAESVDHENKLISAEHGFLDQVYSFQQLVALLDEKIDHDEKEILAIFNSLSILLFKLEKLIKKNVNKEMHIVKNEKKWGIKIESLPLFRKGEKNLIEIEVQQLRLIHEVLLEIKNIIDNSNIISQKTKYVRDDLNWNVFFEQFRQLYNMIWSYENLFREILGSMLKDLDNLSS